MNETSLDCWPSIRRNVVRGFAVIRWLCVVLWLFASGVAFAAQTVKFTSLKAGSRTYYDVVVLGASETDLYFKHSRGISNVKFKLLDSRVQKMFDYDPKAAEEAERRQEQEDAAYHETVALELTERAQRAIKAAKDEAASSEDNLSDPITSQSLLGQAAPKLVVEQWLGDKPDTDGKAVLFFFWTTWSKPSRKAIPDLNSYQKKFRDRLVVIGFSTETVKEIAEFSELKIEFPLAIDPKSRVANASGASSVPFVLLADAKGVVRYQGHPAALDSTKLRKLIAPEAKE
jgi:cytochrome c biogenesis protein CcmG, thiol:disulfide interchange protein DsbE